MNTGEYLNRVEKTDLTIPEQDLQGSVDRLSVPFHDLEQTPDLIEFRVGQGHFKLVYRPHEYKHDGKLYVDQFSKEIDEFILTNDEKSTNVLKFLPQGTKVIVYNLDKKTGDIVEAQGERGLNKRNIVIHSKIDSIYMVAVLLHEIGHIIDYSKLDELALKNMFDDIENSDIAEEIRRERTANAFTLRFLRPLLRDAGLRRDVINVLKHGSLANYYLAAKYQIQERREKPIDLGMSHYYEDFI